MVDLPCFCQQEWFEKKMSSMYVPVSRSVVNLFRGDHFRTSEVA